MVVVLGFKSTEVDCDYDSGIRGVGGDIVDGDGWEEGIREYDVEDGVVHGGAVER